MSDKDIIYRRDAVEAICKACSVVGDYHKCSGYPETSTWCEELVALRALPPADRPQGEWIIEIDVNGDTYGRCSIYGMRQYAGQLNFCPDCGASMRGE